jgi:predicted RNA binding protein YcfA (HicA-like mRNA interferase family)
MPPLEGLPGNINAEKIIRALRRLGFIIDTKGGKGSHVKAIWTNEKFVTIQRKLFKVALKELLKEIESVSGLTWDDIRKEL